MCSSNVKDLSNVKPKYFLWWNLLNWFIIKENWWMYNLFDLTSENNFWRLFRWVRVETHFPLESPFLYFVQILTQLFSFCIWIFINVNKETSSAKRFDFLSDRLYRLKKAEVRVDDEHRPFSKARYFLLSRKLINNCNKFPQITLQRNL